MTDQEVIQAFHIMWDNFPEPVTITQRSREIIAVNKKATELGLTAGIKCSSIGKPEDHKGCLCNKAIDENKSVHVAYEGPQGKAYGFWTPITERPEWILHFSVGRVAEYQEIKR
ncbi:hypothetical protein [Selenomonas ruminantium]|uniref:Uncharacterized protein n=1 Tax=Selenomonas ruminantium TaxID=971 RepID=A0A1H3VH91_SELRU|nr:hypothetical protein [Selenomonas ruminantium]SDZ73548.1 hypothetical protein SAMN05660648_00173 [Selenomonas ruminantium]